MDDKDKLAYTWVWLELTEEQRKAIGEQTGKDAEVVFLSLAELLEGRFVPAEADQGAPPQ